MGIVLVDGRSCLVGESELSRGFQAHVELDG
jgi:hypothetical protein